MLIGLPPISTFIMIIISIKGEITQETVGSLLEKLNERNPGEKTRIYIDSVGGDISAGVMLQDIINKEPDNFELVGTNLLASCAFELFFMARCPKHITPLTRGMHHLPYAMMPVNIKGNLADRETKKYYKELTEELTPRVHYLFDVVGLTKKERDFILKGEDQTFNHSRMLEILKFNREFLANNPEEDVYLMPSTSKKNGVAEENITEGEGEIGSDEPRSQATNSKIDGSVSSDSSDSIETVFYSTDMIVGILVEKGDIVPVK